MDKPTSYQSLPYIFLVGTIYGSNMVVSRFSLGQYAPLTLVSLRLCIAALVYLCIYLFIQKRRFPRQTDLWVKASISGVLSTVIPLSGFLAAMQFISSGLTGLLDTLVPVMVILLAPIFVNEKMTCRRGIGTIIAFGGTALLYLRGENGIDILGQADWRGYGYCFLAITASAMGTLFARRYLRDYDVIDISAMRMISAAIILFPITAIISGFDLSQVLLSGWLALFHLALIGTFLAFLLDFYIIKRFGAIPASQIIYVIPLAALLLGFLILNEKVTPNMLGSMLLIFLGLVLINKD